VFARVLSGKVFGKDIISKRSCLGLCNNDFKNASSYEDKFVLYEGDNSDIWRELINKGYYAIFLTTGHIETAVADGLRSTSYRYRYKNDERYNEQGFRS
jgi:hypothetical protein